MVDINLKGRSLKSRSALASALDETRSSVSLEVYDGVTAAHVAARKGQDAAIAEAFSNAYGVALPQRPGAVSASSLTVIWAGPSQWLIYALDENGRDLELELRAKLGTLASVADQSDARTFVRVAGPASRTTLAKLLPIDVHSRSFPAGAAAITHAAHIGVLVWRSDRPRSPDCFMLACPRSYSGSLWTALLESAEEFGISVG